jgi:FecR protein
MSKLRLAAILVVCVSAVPGMALSQEPAGHILWSFGQVERVGADGAAKPLAKGDPVFEGDLIRSGAGSHAQLVMIDEALVAVRAESSVKLNKYRFGGHEDGTERATIHLLKGGLRSITGAIGRSNKDNYKLKNDMHIIGIRGTDHETFATDGGTYSRVTLGGTYLRAPGGRVDLEPGEVGFASRAPGSAPSRLERTPEFMHLAALGAGDTGPQPRGPAASDERRLQKGIGSPTFGLAAAAASPVLPSQALGENSLQKGWSKGGRCDGPCADPLKNNGKGKPK